MNLELIATRWLRWEKRCLMVINERSPRECFCGRPDVLGITKNRHCIEIEIKRSFSDFKADFRKPSRQDLWRSAHDKKLPRLFYYLTPAALTEKVLPLVPIWAGLLRPTANLEPGYVVEVKRAEILASSKRLSVKECVRIAMMISNHNISLIEKNGSLQNAFTTDWDEDWRFQLEDGFCNWQI